jgi:hypothetical protein
MRPEVVTSGGIAVAAVVLAAGWICILWRRDAQRFQLMQLALEKGVTRFPNTPPFWLLSLRQGVTVLALGVALCGVGTGALLITRDVPEPTVQQQMQAMPGQRLDQMRDNLRDGGPDDQRMQPDQPFPPGDEPGQPGPPGNRNPPRPPLPPMAVPAVENWHRAQATRTVGLLSLGCGAVLLVLGIVRVGFSVVERAAGNEHTRF